MSAAPVPEGLTRPVRDEEVACYAEHGIVHLPGLLDPVWLAEAERVFELVFGEERAEGLNELNASELAPMLRATGAELLASNEEVSQAEGLFKVGTFNHLLVPDLRTLGIHAPMPEVAARLMGANRINFYGDQLFLKEPRSMHRTAFHQDAPYFHLEGDQCCTIWMPLDVVDRSNSAMGYIRGSHRWPIHAANGFVTRQPMPGSPEKPLPDIEGREDDYDIQWVECRPGDAIVHHVRTVHGSTGNTTDRPRRAVSLRYLGEDCRYHPREGTPADSQKSEHLSRGDPMASPEFPLVWTRDEGYLPEPVTG